MPTDLDADRPRAPFSPARIRAGVDRCLAALAAAKAIRDGEDPDDAADIAEGEAAARRLIRSVSCRHCGANQGQPCVQICSGLPMTGYHDSRIQNSQTGAAA